MPTPLLLKGYLQHYAWGKPFSSSLVGKLSGEDHPPDKPCAELWFGAHANGEATDRSTGTKLSDVIASHPLAFLGEQTVARFGPALPYLLKILSVNQPLSIQTHPTLEQAKLLHSRDPANYPDSNHKPEMAIALEPVTLLYGFRREAELLRTVRDTPEFEQLVGSKAITTFLSSQSEKAALKEFFVALMKAESAEIKDASLFLANRLAKAGAKSEAERWIVTEAPRYPKGDVGLFCFLLLNVLQLQVGEAIYISPSIPHAYLAGQMVEVMANSNNVIRAGLTPKFRDSQALAECLEYEPIANPGNAIIRPTAGVYTCPAAEFQIRQIQTSTKLSISSPTTLLLVEGSATINDNYPLYPGDALFLPATTHNATLHLNPNTLLFSTSVP